MFDLAASYLREMREAKQKSKIKTIESNDKDQESTTVVMNPTTPTPIISNNQSTPVDSQNNYYQSYVPQQSTNFHCDYWRLFAGFTPSWNSNMNNTTIVKFNG